ncbi:MAG: hypothetical protein Q7R81_01045 [Candidatus Peregrinibacteria bacterium]|nr:hypothetical protein [Candidatus Peregrinibacteria bacterium]
MTLNHTNHESKSSLVGADRLTDSRLNLVQRAQETVGFIAKNIAGTGKDYVRKFLKGDTKYTRAGGVVGFTADTAGSMIWETAKLPFKVFGITAVGMGGATIGLMKRGIAGTASLAWEMGKRIPLFPAPAQGSTLQQIFNPHAKPSPPPHLHGFGHPGRGAWERHGIANM